MNNSTKMSLYAYLALSITTSLFSPSSSANNDDICSNSDLIMVFFNGVKTTHNEASRALVELELIHGKYSEKGDRIKYESLYNYSAGFEDFVEVFEQRLYEHDEILKGRFELFLGVLNGGDQWWKRVINSLPNAKGLLDGLLEWYKAHAINQLSKHMGNPPTIDNYQEHMSRIDTWLVEGNKLLYVAHSQGNLFANAAYDYAVTKVSKESVEIVHIAPASASVNGLHTLANFDLVINGLRVAGLVPDNTTDIPAYLERLPGLNGETDILGHGLLEIYLNPNLATSTRISKHINDAMLALEAPEREAAKGLFTATLTWNGIKVDDVDLHVFEPNGDHVYYRDEEGYSGYLDQDNSGRYPLEHYFVRCNEETIQAGTYDIRVANYADAEGMTATVQISSYNNGVLGTQSVVLGEETKDHPAHHFFKVKVSKSNSNNKFNVSLE